jgi:hypothetical protein
METNLSNMVEMIKAIQGLLTALAALFAAYVSWLTLRRNPAQQGVVAKQNTRPKKPGVCSLHRPIEK